MCRARSSVACTCMYRDWCVQVHPAAHLVTGLVSSCCSCSFSCMTCLQSRLRAQHRHCLLALARCYTLPAQSKSFDAMPRAKCCSCLTMVLLDAVLARPSVTLAVCWKGFSCTNCCSPRFPANITNMVEAIAGCMVKASIGTWLRSDICRSAFGASGSTWASTTSQ